MNKYFLLGGTETKSVASAIAPKSTDLAHELIDKLESINILPFEFDLVKLTVGNNGLIRSDDLSDLDNIWLDYLPNSLAWPLMSEKMKNTIDLNISNNVDIDWIRATINGPGEKREYFVLRFKEMHDILDRTKSTIVPSTGFIVKPCFSLSKIAAYSIFTIPETNNHWKITPAIYISDSLRKAIRRDKLSGVVFEQICTS